MKEIFTLLGFYAAWIGWLLQAFLDNLSVSFCKCQSVQDCLPFEDGTIMLHNITEEQRSPSLHVFAAVHKPFNL